MGDLELQSVSLGRASPSPSCSEDEELLAPLRRDRVRHDCKKTAWGRSQYRERNHKSTWFHIPFFIRRPLQLIFAFTLVLAGVLMTLTVTAFWNWMSTDPFDVTFAHFWDDQFSSPRNPVKYPLDFFGSVLPVPCHSHNDYWRRTPLFAALGSGCVSVEADIWLQNEDLYVGHTRFSLHDNATLRSMYINHLVGILDVINAPATSRKDIDHPLGIFYNDPMQTLTLLIDFKTPDVEIWSLLYQQLQPLRDRGWLSYWNGTDRIERPITVVVSGSADFDVLVANQTYRDIFFDAPLEALEDESDNPPNFKYNPSNSHLASVNFHKAVGPVLHTRLSDEQVETLRRQIRNARERHLIPRYWGTPRWPRGLRDGIWALLVQEEVGLLNVDDLRAVRKGQWGLWPQGGS